jgi:hypothetical protein
LSDGRRRDQQSDDNEASESHVSDYDTRFNRLRFPVPGSRFPVPGMRELSGPVQQHF